MSDSTANVTLLLHAAASGDRKDVDALMAAIYQDLRRLALAHMSEERRDHTLQATALVHEAYVKLIDQRNTNWNDRVHFFSVASRIVRRILIDHARARNAEKRGGPATRVAIGEQDIAAPQQDLDVIALHEALEELASLDEQQARIVELRYFGGCTIEEIAELLKVGKRTVDRQWLAAKTWLFDRLSEGDTTPGGDRGR
ncbi:MAG TPA: sigma-70 family RNA polymerase sigma factor [Phycisphaerales bacterium]